MTLNFTRTIATLARIGAPVNFNSTKIEVDGTEVIFTKKGLDVTIQTKTLPELSLKFTKTKFDPQAIVFYLINALAVSSNQISKDAFQYIKTEMQWQQDWYYYNKEKNTTAIVLPLENKLIFTVFRGNIAELDVKVSMSVPLVEKSDDYIKILRSIM